MFYQSLEYLKTGGLGEYEDNSELLNFTITTMSGNEVELIPGGSKLSVTLTNYEQFIKLAQQFRLNEMSQQLNAIRQGFLRIVPKPAIALLTAKELQERISGKRDIDIEYLKQHTEYYGLTIDSPVIKYFWDSLRSFSNEQRSLFLRFVWGRSTLPPSSEEFTEKFCVSRLEPPGIDISEDQMLPQAHTCGFQIELPRYSSEKVMREKLLYAITNCIDIDLEWQSNSSSDPYSTFYS